MLIGDDEGSEPHQPGGTLGSRCIIGFKCAGVGLSPLVAP
jgi:hypothetical protein